jgi:hypothetical protein
MLAATLTGAATDGQWHTDYAQALAAAKADSKPLLVVLHKPDQPEQSIQQVSHVEKTEQATLGNYHLCQIDVTSPTGKAVADAFKATSFPYTVITDKRADQVILRKTGTFSDGEWKTTLSEYRRGVRPISYSSTFTGAINGYCPCCQGR